MNEVRWLNIWKHWEHIKDLPVNEKATVYILIGIAHAELHASKQLW